MLPLIPVMAQKISVNQFREIFIPVINVMRFSANSEPMPEREETSAHLTKCFDFIILIRHINAVIPKIIIKNLALSGIFDFFSVIKIHIISFHFIFPRKLNKIIVP